MSTNRFLLLLPITMGCASLQAAPRQDVGHFQAGVIHEAGEFGGAMKSGPITTAARHPFVGAAWRGPTPQPLPGNVRPKPHPNAHKSSIPKSARVQTNTDSSNAHSDGQRGFVELLPPPPDATDTTVESRYYELPPAPEK